MLKISTTVAYPDTACSGCSNLHNAFASSLNVSSEVQVAQLQLRQTKKHPQGASAHPITADQSRARLGWILAVLMRSEASGFPVCMRWFGVPVPCGMVMSSVCAAPRLTGCRVVCFCFPSEPQDIEQQHRLGHPPRNLHSFIFNASVWSSACGFALPFHSSAIHWHDARCSG